jgi:deoxycytidylate deaminase
MHGCTGPRCNDGQGAGVGLTTCLCIHAEENALLEAGRERIREGSILYCDTCVFHKPGRDASTDLRLSDVRA